MVPCCPNHGEPLEGIGSPPPSEGTGICPVSGCPFDYKADWDEHEIVRHIDGSTHKIPKWKLTGEEN